MHFRECPVNVCKNVWRKVVERQIGRNENYKGAVENCKMPHIL